MISTKKLSPQQIDQYKSAFQMFDIDGDGCITANELRIIMQKFSYSPSEDEIKNMIKNIDTDKSGTIELSQFLAFVENHLADNTQDNEGDMLQAFKIFDKDGNGRISKAELKEGMKILGQKMSNQDIDMLMEEIDLNGDGEIDFQQLTHLMKNVR